MNTGEALFQAILESPDEDAPRLVYADWLEENGDLERSEFIRLEVKLHRLRKSRSTADDERRHSDLLVKLRKTWLEQMPKLPGVRWWGFLRGFPTVQVDNWPALEKHAAKIWAASPCEEVCFNLLSAPGGRALGRSPWLAKVRTLEFTWIGTHYMPGFRALLQSPQLEHLRELNLKSCGLGDEGVTLLSQCPYLTNLKELVLECNDIEDAGALAFARTPHFPRLKRLWMGRNPFEDKTAISELQRRWGKHCC